MLKQTQPARLAAVDWRALPAETGCPPRAGYTALVDTTWNLRVSSYVSPAMSALEAEVACSSTYNCAVFTVWDDSTAYILQWGRVQTYNRNDGVCTYVKQGCPPRPGYTAFTDASWYLRASYLDLHKASAAHAEAACNANPDCPGFTLASDGTAEYVVNGTIVNFEMNYGVCTYIKSGAWGNAACDCLDSYLMGDRLYTGCAIDYRDKPFCVVSPLSCKNPDYYMTDLKGTLPAIFCTFGPGIAIRPSAPPTPPPALPPPVYKLIRSGACGACLVAEPWEGGRLTTAPCNPASLYQQFQLEQASDGAFTIKTRADTRIVVDYYAGVGAGTTIGLWSAHTGQNQRWALAGGSSGASSATAIKSLYTTGIKFPVPVCMRTQYGGTVDGAVCDGGLNQTLYVLDAARCPSRAGYTVLIDTEGGESFQNDHPLRIYQTTPTNAEASCNADPNCAVWDNSGRYLVGVVARYSRAPGRCTYVKNGDWGNGVCSCLPTYVVGGVGSGATFAGCTELLATGRPWCYTDHSCKSFNFTHGSVDGTSLNAIFCTSGPGISGLRVFPSLPSPPEPPSMPDMPAVPVPPTPYPYGCFADTPNGRTMPVVLAWDKKDLTLEYCAALARAAGLRLYGVQFSWFCFGGNDLSLATSLGPSVECTMPCGGNSNQICGGPYANNVYILDGLSPPPSPEPPSPSPPPPVASTAVSRTVLIDGRRLPFLLAWNKKDLTLEDCAALARAFGLMLYGVQFSWFCFGGNDMSLATSLGPSEECTMPCGGNSNQICGGPYASNVYRLDVLSPPPSPNPPSPPLPPTPPPGGQTGLYYGCFHDSDKRTMPVVLAWDKKDLTLEDCAALARAAGLRLYGVQFSWFCFGGNDLSLATSLGHSEECTRPCGGNSSQVCGGPYTNGVYIIHELYKVQVSDYMCGSVTTTYVNTVSDGDLAAYTKLAALAARTDTNSGPMWVEISAYAAAGTPLGALHGDSSSSVGAEYLVSNVDGLDIMAVRACCAGSSGWGNAAQTLQLQLSNGTILYVGSSTLCTSGQSWVPVPAGHWFAGIQTQSQPSPDNYVHRVAFLFADAGATFKLIRNSASELCLVAQPWPGAGLLTAPCNPSSLDQQFWLDADSPPPPSDRRVTVAQYVCESYQAAHLMAPYVPKQGLDQTFEFLDGNSAKHAAPPVSASTCFVPVLASHVAR
eukprot:XP_001703343.1 predicted protein [Chlamydomonas reinhardtii]